MHNVDWKVRYDFFLYPYIIKRIIICFIEHTNQLTTTYYFSILQYSCIVKPYEMIPFPYSSCWLLWKYTIILAPKLISLDIPWQYDEPILMAPEKYELVHFMQYKAGIIFGMDSANERLCYIVSPHPEWSLSDTVDIDFLVQNTRISVITVLITYPCISISLWLNYSHVCTCTKVYDYIYRMILYTKLLWN